MKKGKTVRGLKLLREDWSSITYDRIYYGKKWQEIPGNGAYIAESGSIDCGGRGPVLALLECRDRLGDGPDGVGRYRFVRLIRAVPSEKPLKAYNDAYATAQKTFDYATAQKTFDYATAQKTFDDAIAPAFRQILMAAVRAPRKGKRVRR